MELKQSILFALCLFLLTAIIYLFIENNNLKNQVDLLSQQLDEKTAILKQTEEHLHNTTKKLTEKENELKTLKNELLAAQSELNSTKQQLEEKENELRNATSNIEMLKRRYDELNRSLAYLKEEIASIEENIKEYVGWFKENANFDEEFLSANDVYSFLRTVEKKCVDGGINLGCLPFVMKKELDFKYVAESSDKLYSLEEMVKNKGGDCEDFSIFVKALLNYLKNTSSADPLLLNAWKMESGSRFIVYQESNKYWYIDNADKYYIGDLRDLNPVVFCYTISCNEERCDGHCAVGLSKIKIENVDDINNLSNSKLFEPQTGEYLGFIGGSYTLCEKGIDECEKKKNHIFVIIGDNDLYVYKNGTWTSYGYYLKALEKLKEEAQ